MVNSPSYLAIALCKTRNFRDNRSQTKDLAQILWRSLARGILKQMFHYLFILAFGIIATIAAVNLVRSFMMLSSETRMYPNFQANSSQPQRPRPTPHPEMIDDQGQPINEPLLVVRSLDVEDARQRLDNLYNSSPSNDKADGNA